MPLMSWNVVELCIFLFCGIIHAVRWFIIKKDFSSSSIIVCLIFIFLVIRSLVRIYL